MTDITALQYVAEADVRIDILTKANAALTAANAEMRKALEAIRESVRDNDMFRVGQYVTAALARKS